MRRSTLVRNHRIANTIVLRVGMRKFHGGELLYLTTTGRRTGKKRTAPLLYLEDHDRWIVVAGNGGADWEPGWWLNLQAGMPATIDVNGVVTPVTGVEVCGPEHDRLWRELNEMFDFDLWQLNVRRRLAIVALSPDRTR
jgi:deazaflavin-dependent oxidoreductase (nitroreductase family)